MKRLALAIVLGLAACAGVAPPRQEVSSASCNPVEGCLQLERGDGGSPVIRATLNGDAPFFFVLDTGASNTSLNDAAVARLGLESEPNKDQGLGMGGSLEVPLYRLRAFTAGPLSAEGELMPNFPGPSFESHSIAGIAGVSLFADRLALWDMRAMQVRVLPSGRSQPAWSEVSSN